MLAIRITKLDLIYSSYLILFVSMLHIFELPKFIHLKLITFTINDIGSLSKVFISYDY